MSEYNWQKVETIIDRALDLPEKARARYIDQACGGDPELKGEVTLLLESIFEADGWLEDPRGYKEEFYEEISQDIELISEHRSLIGTSVGAYQIIEKIGEGGMGTVYRAERKDGKFEHQVAIKIIRDGRATQQNIRRFQQEQQILAGLNHPGIAHLFDAGVTEQGSPFIIMEYVEGVPVDQFIESNGCSPAEIVSLLKKVLQAVQHAHENLVIHRDLKPGNILVTENREVKILDFGISKLLEETADNPMITKTGSRLLTPRYAAPEQVLESNITTATDLYAIGILMYELLAGTGPFEFADCSRHEMEQIIIKGQPKPMAQQADEDRPIPGDLEAICQKAIRKEPTDRYRMANEFLEDLDNFEEGRPVTAQKGTYRYRFLKFLRRHKQVVGLAAGMILLLIGLTGFYTWRIAQERNQARQEAERAEQVKDFMLTIFDRTNPDKETYSGREITASELLTAGLQKTETELADQPEMYIEMMATIGDAFANIDHFDKADQALLRALRESRQYYGSNHPETAGILSDLANYNHEIQAYDKAESYILEALQIDSMHLSETQTSKLPGDLSIYASNQFLQSKYHKARSLFMTVDSLRGLYGKQNTVDHHVALANLGETNLFLGNYDQAAANLQKALDFFQDHYEGVHDNIVTTTYRIGLLNNRRGNYEKAEKYLLQSLEGYREVYGNNNSNLSANYGMLARNYRLMGKLDQAETYARKDTALTRTLFGDTSAMYAKSLNNLAIIQKAGGKLKMAQKNYQHALNLYRKHMESTNPDLAIPMYNLADVLADLGNYGRAETLMRKVVSIDKNRLGKTHPEIAIDLNKLGSILMRAGKLAESEAVFSEARPIFMEKFPENHYRIGEYLLNHGELKRQQNQQEKATRFIKEGLSIYQENFEPDDPRVQEAQRLLSGTSE